MARKPEQPPGEQFLELKQVARMYGVAPSTVSRWIASGKLFAMRLAGGRYRIKKSDAEALLAPVEPSRPCPGAGRVREEREARERQEQALEFLLSRGYDCRQTVGE